MRTLVAILAVTSWFGCGPASTRNDGDGGASTPDACVGLECRVAKCAERGLPPTTLSGTVYAPNGTLALYGATVYIPNGDPGLLPEGATCARCDAALPGGSVADASSDEAGNFTLTNVPTGRNVPLIVQIGKWRRIVDIPEVQECTDNPLPATVTSLPKNKSEGNLPKIAIATGSCDALECLIRKLGVSDSEFTPEGGAGSIHLYASNGVNKLANNTPFTAATSLWGDLDKLKQYDITMFSCECSQLANQKPQAAMDALKAYADFGGRAFLSHYHNVWIDGESNNPAHAPAVWPTIATCGSDEFIEGSATIDTVNNPKGGAFSAWMTAVMGSPSPGVIPLQSGSGRITCTGIDNTKAERWVYYTEGAQQAPQNFQFTTPNEAPEDNRCGKVVFSDMHVASGSSSSSSTGFPGGCSTAALTPQEKALAFMFFDIASCVGVIL